MLDKWYWLDLNAVPGIYYLQPRRDKFADYSIWESKVERPLRAILQKAVSKMKISDNAIEKYFASATEQEIIKGALNVADSKEHIFCFYRNIENFENMIQNMDSDPTAKDFVNTDQHGKYDGTAGHNQKELKNRLKNLPPREIFEYSVKWVGSSKKENLLGKLFKRNRKSDDKQFLRGISFDHLNRLCEDVYRSLSTVILEEVEKIQQVEEIDQEIEEHNTFYRSIAKSFMGRRDILKMIHRYIDETSNPMLVVYGDSGSGKSALMAKALEEALEESKVRHPEYLLLYRFIGVTPGSMELRDLLESLCQQLYKKLEIERFKLAELEKISDLEKDANKKRMAIESKYMLPHEVTELQSKFIELIKLVPSKLILFLDSLDQLSPNDKIYASDWLPKELLPNVRVIVSTVQSDGPEGEFLTSLTGTLLGSSFLKLPDLEQSEAEALLRKWLIDAKRTLQDEQWEEVLEKFSQCPLPLYLKLAFEESCKWRYYAEKPAGGNMWRRLGNNIEGVIKDMLTRLEDPTNHGSVLVSRSLSYLAASKNGLSEKEMIDILSLDDEVIASFRSRSLRSPNINNLPIVVWSRLYLDLKPYLTERNADNSLLLTFYHRQFEKTIAKTYLTKEMRLYAHRQIAKYFSRKFSDDTLNVETIESNRPDYRKVSELPYQQTFGELWNDLCSTLTNLSFVEEKCLAGALFSLIRDYDLAIDVWKKNNVSEQEECIKIFETWKYAIVSCADICIINPQLTLNHVSYELGRRDKKYTDFKFSNNIVSQHKPWLWTTRISEKAGSSKGLSYQKEAHRGDIAYIVMSENGALLASSGEDGSIVLWKNDTAFIQRAVLHKPEESWNGALIHPDLIPRVSMSGNGDIVVGIINCSKLCYWDTLKSTDERIIMEKKLFLGNPVVNKSGTCVALGPTYDYIGISIVEINSGKDLDKTELPRLNQYSGMLLSADADLNRIAIARTKGHLWLWDRTLKPKGSIVKICPQLNRVNSVAVSRKGDIIVAATGHPEFEVFLIRPLENDWTISKKLGAHKEVVESVAISDDSNWVASVGDDGMVFLWDIRKEPPECRSARLQMSSGFNLLTSLSIEASGKFVIVGGHDGKLYFLSRECMGSELHAETSNEFTPVRKATISKDRKSILWVDRSGNIGISSLDLSNRRLICKANALYAEVAISSLGDLCGWIQDSGTLRFIRYSPKGLIKMEMNLRPEIDEIISRLCISDDGGYAAVGTEDGKAVLIKVGDRDLRLIGHNYDSSCRPCRAISTNGSWIAIGSMEPRTGAYKGYLSLWDGGSKTIVMETPHSDYISSLTVAGNPPLVASGSANGEVWIWSVSKKTPIAIADTKFSDRVLALDFHPSLKWLAAAGADQWLRIFDVSTGRMVSCVRTHDGPVTSCQFSIAGDKITLMSIGPLGEPVVNSVYLAGNWTGDFSKMAYQISS